jgi:uncharacterized protein DUF4258
LDCDLNIDWTRQQIRSGAYEFNGHAEDERQVDRFTISEVEEALLNGEILEDYPNDPRGPSCLVPATPARAIQFTWSADKLLRYGSE